MSAVVFSQFVVLFYALQSDCRPPSTLLNGHMSTTQFIVCC